MPCAKLLALGLLALVGTLAASPAPARKPAPRPSVDPVVLLRQSMTAPRTVSYEGQFETVRFSSNRASATIVKIEHRSPGLTRRWFVAPEALFGDYVITRGTATYQFDTKRGRVTISHNPTVDNQVVAGDDFDQVMQNYRAIADGSETVANRPTVSIVLVNKYTGERALRVWIDRSTHLVLKKEEYHGNGSVASQSRFEELRYTSAIPDGIFSSDAPNGYAQVAGISVDMPNSDIDRVIKEAGFRPVEPKALPQGFTVENGGVTTVNGVRTLHLVYSDGLRSISLFENATGAAAEFGTLRPKSVTFEGHDAQYVEDGPTTLLTWREHGLYFALVGDLLQNEMIAIAKSVVP